ncbi:TolC family protein [Calidithermus roseus]|uniref:Outer membrane protein TolC n=1 Tax=Calidithermus roseus TaxID=1644118 RepID=A0A399EQW5_9DEIN|nr:TolC family protein [Calidithermus roseus]RIH87037.1 Outer membrane protein TolC [Calidithermus roseus]
MRRSWIGVLGVLWGASSLGQAQGLSLEAALAALPRTVEWQNAELAYESALRSLEAAQAAVGLKVTGSGSYSLGGSQSASSSTSGQNLSLGASASMTVLPWSSAYDSIASAQRALERAALTRRDSRNSLVINLTSQYFALRQAQQAEALAQATLRLRENQLRVAQARYQAGQASFTDFLSAQQDLDSARLDAASASGNLEIARQALASTLGLAPAALSSLSTAPSAPTLPSTPLESLIEQAMSRRSDVLAALSRLQDAQASLASAQRDRWLPDASLSLSYSNGASGSSGGGSTSVTAGLNFKSGSASLGTSIPLVSSATSTGTSVSSWNLGLSLALPVLAPSSDAQLSNAQTALELAQLSLQSARRSAELDVRQKYLAAQSALAKVSLAQGALSSAAKNLETAEARLKAGTGTALEVQSAQVGRQQAQNNLEATTAQAYLAWLNLHSALGADLTALASPHGGNP